MKRILICLLLFINIAIGSTIKEGFEAYKSRDYSKAFGIFMSLSRENDSSSFLGLGFLFENGKGVDKNTKRAFEYFLKSANLGNPLASYKTATYYDFKYKKAGIKQDFKKAFEWYLKAAKKGNKEAQFNLATFYEYNENTAGIKQDKNKAFYWYLKSAQNGLSRSQYKVGKIYENKENYREAFRWYSEASSLGNLYAKLALANFYMNGIFVKKNIETAIALLRKASKLRNGIAETNLGILYHLDKYNKQNYIKAVRWYKKAPKNKVALNNLGNIYRNGLGVKVDKKKAYSYYLKSANLGDPIAQENLKNMCKKNPWVCKGVNTNSI